ncbi:MAG: Uma2 family endonuclease [Anaerolineae bacterium]
MMVALPKPVTIEDFEAFSSRPENADRIFELINGEIIEVPSDLEASKIAHHIGHLLAEFLKDHDLGTFTGDTVGYAIHKDRYMPDVAFMAHPKGPCTAWFNPEPPDLVVEVDYPSTLKSRRVLSVKIAHYLLAGIVVWAVYPDERSVDVFAPGHEVITLDENGTLDGGSMLPGFTLPVSKIFPKKASE